MGGRYAQDTLKLIPRPWQEIEVAAVEVAAECLVGGEAGDEKLVGRRVLGIPREHVLTEWKLAGQSST